MARAQLNSLFGGRRLSFAAFKDKQMFIKPDADAAYFSNRPEERAIALQLGEAFEVTFGLGHGQLAFWLLGPLPHTKERFGLQKEVLAIYYQHPTTDARVLTAIENIK